MFSVKTAKKVIKEQFFHILDTQILNLLKTYMFQLTLFVWAPIGINKRVGRLRQHCGCL